MNKAEFIDNLRAKLSGLPESEIEERLAFYSEMIDDRVEDGRTEEQAVDEIGSIDEIATQTLADTSLLKLAKEKFLPKRKLEPWEIILIVLSAPIWFSILISLFAVVISIYASLWAGIISLWAAEVSLIACAGSAIFISLGLAIGGNFFGCLAILGTALILAGLSILMFYGCKFATKAITFITTQVPLLIKKCFVNKGEK